MCTVCTHTHIWNLVLFDRYTHNIKHSSYRAIIIYRKSVQPKEQFKEWTFFKKPLWKLLLVKRDELKSIWGWSSGLPGIFLSLEVCGWVDSNFFGEGWWTLVKDKGVLTTLCFTPGRSSWQSSSSRCTVPLPAPAALQPGGHSQQPQVCLPGHSYAEEFSQWVSWWSPGKQALALLLWPHSET